MKASDIFGLLVRALGLVFLYYGLMAVSTILPAIFSSGLGPILGILWAVGWPFLVAYILIRGAPWFVYLAYPNADDEE